MVVRSSILIAVPVKIEMVSMSYMDIEFSWVSQQNLGNLQDYREWLQLYNTFLWEIFFYYIPKIIPESLYRHFEFSCFPVPEDFF